MADHARIRGTEVGATMTAYSALMFAARITLPHFSVSWVMSLPKSAGKPGSAVAAHSASRAFSFGSARAALTSVLSLSTISAGVFLGATIPNTCLEARQETVHGR